MPGTQQTPLRSGQLSWVPRVPLVYQILGHDGELLYVGVTDDLVGRMAGHQRAHARWLNEAATIVWQEYPTMREAKEAESWLIIDEGTKYNVIYNDGRTVVEELERFRRWPTSKWVRLAVVVRARRRELGYSQTSFAYMTGVSVEALRALEHEAAENCERDFLNAIERGCDGGRGQLRLSLPMRRRCPYLTLRSRRLQSPPLDKFRRKGSIVGLHPVRWTISLDCQERHRLSANNSRRVPQTRIVSSVVTHGCGDGGTCPADLR
jgi:predicted GIY-YIG superfamily endonuclease/DNA-binding XRE family transcriptional regulator